MPSKAYQVLYGNLGSKFGKLGGRPSNKLYVGVCYCGNIEFGIMGNNECAML